MTSESGEVVFVNKLFGDVTKFDLDIFGSVQQCAQVEVAYVRAGKYTT